MDIDIGGVSVSDGEGCDNSINGTHTLRNQMNSSNNCGNGKLKRSSSAPMINQLLPQGSLQTPSSSSNSNIGSLRDLQDIQPRARRLSANFGPVSPLSPGSSKSSTRMRVCQLREEEGMDVVNREAAHERTVQSSLQVAQSLSQSWEDLALSEERRTFSCGSNSSSLPKKDYNDQLSLTITSTSPFSGGASSGGVGCGASPTRVGRQCFSPSLQQPVRNYSFCPSPSPTKKSFKTRRSLSPIPLRPSPLGGIKRKWDQEEAFTTPNKRLSSSCTPDRCLGGLLIAHPLSLENTPSPAGPVSIGSVGTPESVCSSGSPAPTPEPPAHLFKPLSPAPSTPAGLPSSNALETSELRFGLIKPPSSVSSSSAGEGSDDNMMVVVSDESSAPSSVAPATPSGDPDLKAYHHHQAMDLSESTITTTSIKYS